MGDADALRKWLARRPIPLKQHGFDDLAAARTAIFRRLCEISRKPVWRPALRYATRDERCERDAIVVASPAALEAFPIGGSSPCAARMPAILDYAPGDYEAGNVLSDLFGATEFQRLDTRVFDASRGVHWPSLVESWNAPGFALRRAVAVEMVRAAEGKRAESGRGGEARADEGKRHEPTTIASGPEFYRELREALYRVTERQRRQWGPEAAQFGAVKSKLVLAALVALLAEPRPPSGFAVLDTSMGWGDRLLAAGALPEIGVYVGFEPNVALFRSYGEICDTVEAARGALGWLKLRTCLFAEGLPRAASAAPPPRVHIAFTSPPYFNKEIYARGAPSQSTARFTSLDAWFEGFFCAMLSFTWEQLLPGGIMAIHLADVSGLDLVSCMNAWCHARLPGWSWLGVLGLQGAHILAPVWVSRRA